MSRSLYRVRSAGSRQQEQPALKEQVMQLQQELLKKNAECQKATDQLNCLIMMVKRYVSADLLYQLRI